MHSKEDFIKDWDASNIQLHNIVKIRVGLYFYWLYINPTLPIVSEGLDCEAKDLVTEELIVKVTDDSPNLSKLGQCIKDYYSSKYPDKDVKFIRVYSDLVNMYMAMREAYDYHNDMRR